MPDTESLIVTKRTWRGQQDLCAEVVARSDRAVRKTYRASIRRNAYDFQSNARVEWWGPNGWVTVLTRSIQETALHAHTYVAKDGTWESDALASCERLLFDASTTLGSEW
jgi:hypothetical protein